MSATVLVLNAGSSSIKFTLYAVDDKQLATRFDGQIEGIGGQAHFAATDAQGVAVYEQRWQGNSHDYALQQLIAWLDPQLDEAGLLGVGHRVVHGGPTYSTPVLVSAAVLQELEALVPLAPLHQPHNLAGMRAAAQFLPGVPQVACFDTAFHRAHPLVADQFALPLEYYKQGVRRYGFHGLSYEYIVRALPTVAPELATGRVVVAHLGNGASMCAIANGQPVDTTMSFTALDGLPMGTRSGNIDPGVLLYLLQQKGMSAAQLEELLYKRSGLLGLSGLSNDMRTLLASASPQAAQAVDYFVYQINRELGALVATLGGLDGLIFTAGIGERAAAIRARVCQQAAWLGIELDATANEQHGPRISAATSRVAAWVIPTDEERMIATHTLAVLNPER